MKIFIIDKDEKYQFYMKELMQEKHDVFTFFSYESAFSDILSLLRQKNILPSIIFCDSKTQVNMDIVQFSKKIDRIKRFISLFEMGSSFNKETNYYSSMRGFLKKPIYLEHLNTIIDGIEREERLSAILKTEQDTLFHTQRIIEMGTLTSGIAHEINNPNTFISMNSQTLALIFSKINEDISNFSKYKDKIENCISGISNGSQRITDIVNSLSSFIRKNKIKNLATNFDTALDYSLNLLKDCVWNIKIEKKSELDDSTASVEIDETHLQQILTNIIKNACEELRAAYKDDLQKARIRIVTKIVDSYFISCKIEDNGRGIREDLLDKVQTPFFSTKEQEKNNQSGLGLGLHIVTQIINSYNGNLKIYNNHNKKGATFEIMLPLVKEK